MTVTQRIKEVKQPRGGYIKPSQFTVVQLENLAPLHEEENITPNMVGTVVDYLTRYMMGSPLKEAFSISLEGAERVDLAERVGLGYSDALSKANDYLKEIKNLDDNSIIHACKIVTFDIWKRNVMAALSSPNTEIAPDVNTIQNIRTMVERSIEFFKQYGPIVKDGFTFEPTGYTKIVASGDGDFLTCDTLWDFKVSKTKPTSKHTLQLLMYWIMGQHSGKEEFKTINKLGIFNPRLNSVYLLNITDIPKEVIQTVESDVICY